MTTAHVSAAEESVYIRTEKIKIKTPLRTLTVIHKNASLLKEIQLLEAIIKKELNIKNITYMYKIINFRGGRSF